VGILLSDTRNESPQLATDRSKFLIGLGTHGSEVTDSVLRLVEDQFGIFPSSCSHLTVDAADGTKYRHPNRHKQFGFNGIGTVAALGKEAFRCVYADVMKNLQLSIEDLDTSDVNLPVSKSAREALDIVIIAGNGGSSGGALDESITMAHQLFQKLRVTSARLKLYYISHEAALDDPSRTVSQNQRSAVMQTAACNLARLASDFYTNGRREYRQPGTDAFSMPTNERVWAHYVMSGSNGHHRMTLTDDFNLMMSHVILNIEFTHGGISLEDRVKDSEMLHDFRRNAMDIL